MSQYGFFVKKELPKQAALHQQVIKLTKENQYLHTRIKVISEKMELIFRGKEKYKNKYKNIKQLMSAKPIDIYQTMRSNKDLRGFSTGKISSTTQKHLSIQNFVQKEDKNKSYTQNLEQTISKINENIQIVTKKLQQLTKLMQKQQCAALLLKITELGGILSTIAAKLKKSQEKSQKESYYSEMLLQESPHHTKGKKKTFESQLNQFNSCFNESKSERSLPKEFELQQKKKSIKRNKELDQNRKRQQEEQDGLQEDLSKDKNWNVLKEIGQELQNWKFSLSDSD